MNFSECFLFFIFPHFVFHSTGKQSLWLTCEKNCLWLSLGIGDVIPSKMAFFGLAVNLLDYCSYNVTCVTSNTLVYIVHVPCSMFYIIMCLVWLDITPDHFSRKCILKRLDRNKFIYWRMSFFLRAFSMQSWIICMPYVVLRTVLSSRATRLVIANRTILKQKIWKHRPQ